VATFSDGCDLRYDLDPQDKVQFQDLAHHPVGGIATPGQMLQAGHEEQPDPATRQMRPIQDQAQQAAELRTSLSRFAVVEDAHQRQPAI
jgi:hypothetical protein